MEMSSENTLLTRRKSGSGLNGFFMLMPVLGNIITGLVFFVSAKRMADSGAGSFMVASTMTCWAATYTLTAFTSGYLLNGRNAVRFLCFYLSILLISLLGLIFMPGLKAQYFWLMGTGAGIAGFYTSFQNVISLLSPKVVQGAAAVARSTAVYTFSWSFGLASGPLVTALVWGMFSPEDGWKYCYWITVGTVLILLLGTFLLKRAVDRSPSSSPCRNAATGNETPAENLPDLMRWVLCFEFGGYFAITMMRTYLPDFCTGQLSFTTFQQGLIMAAISYAQAFTGLLCFRAHKWGSRLPVPLAAALSGIAGMLIFAVTSSPVWYLAAAVMLGIFSGIFCYLATFHALVNTARTPRYVAGVETIVGVTSILCPQCAGLVSVQAGTAAPFFLGMTTIFAGAVCLAFGIVRTRKH